MNRDVTKRERDARAAKARNDGVREGKRSHPWKATWADPDLRRTLPDTTFRVVR